MFVKLLCSDNERTDRSHVQTAKNVQIALWSAVSWLQYRDTSTHFHVGCDNMTILDTLRHAISKVVMVQQCMF